MTTLRPATRFNYSALTILDALTPENRKRLIQLQKELHTTPEWFPTRGTIPYLNESLLKSYDLTPDSPEFQNLAANWLTHVIELARENPNVFIELAMSNDWGGGKPLKQTWFHIGLQLLLNKSNRALIAFPRGAGKTTQIIGRIIWEIGRNPDLRVKLVAESDDVAAQRLYEIKSHLERNAWVHLVFPHLKPGGEQGKWTAHAIYVKRKKIMRDPTVSAHGILTSGTGGRSDILIGDDVVGRRNAITLATLRSEVKNTWRSVWINQLVPGGKVWYIATPWHLDDLTHEIAKIETYDSYIVTVGEDFSTPWPDAWSREWLQRVYDEIGPLEFARAYWLRAAAESESPVVRDYVTFEDPEVFESEGDDVDLVISADLATGAGEDYFAVVLLAVNWTKRKIMVLDYINEHYRFLDQIEKIIEMTEKTGAKYVVVETVAYQRSLYEALLASQRFSHTGAQLIAYTPAKSKRIRLETIVGHLANGRVVFSRRLSPNAHGGKGLLVRQLVDFGIEKHDDLADAFAQGVLFVQDRLHFWRAQTGLAVTILD